MSLWDTGNFDRMCLRHENWDAGRDQFTVPLGLAQLAELWKLSFATAMLFGSFFRFETPC
jgi:hypothetical protein